MRTPSRAILRLALAGWLGLVGLSQLPARARAQAPTPPENVLPDSTFALPEGQRRAGTPPGVRAEPVRPALGRPGDEGLEGRPDREDRRSRQAAEGEDRRHDPRAARAPPGGDLARRRRARRSEEPRGGADLGRRRQERGDHDQGPDPRDPAGRAEGRQGLDRDVPGLHAARHPVPRRRSPATATRPRTTGPSRPSSGPARGASSPSAATSTP